MSPARYVATGMIRAYQLVVSPVLGANCRFDPGCSSYALEAVRRFGTLRGVWLALRRIARCHPWGGGHDPVPESLREAGPAGRLE